MANDIDYIIPQSSESPDTAMAPIPGHDVAPSSENIVIAPIPDNDLAPNSDDVAMASIPDHDLAPSSQASEPADNTYNKIINVTQKKRKKERERS